MNKEPTEKYCSKCNKKKKIKDDFYLAANDTINVDGRLPICKKCLIGLVDMNDVETLINAMRMVDRPFLNSTYEDSFSKKNSFGEYMRMLGTLQNRERTYLDSVFNKNLEKFSSKKEMATFHEEIESDKDGYTKDSLKTLKKKWGDFENEDYEFLEDYYGEYAITYDTNTPVQIMLYKNIAKVHLQAGKELSQGNSKQYKELMELSSKLHNDGNIKPIQNTGANEDRGLSTYGLWIKEIEKEEPCEFFEEKSQYEDYDSFNKYWEKWFIRPFKNIFNISNDFDVGEDDDK